MPFHRAMPSHPKTKPNSTSEVASSTLTSTSSSTTSSTISIPSPKPSIFSAIFSSRSSRSSRSNLSSNSTSTSSTSMTEASAAGEEVEATGSQWVHPPLKYVDPPDQHHVRLLARWAWEEDCRGERGLWEGRRGSEEVESDREDVGPRGEKW